jgi:hypothetical protein
LPIEIRKKTIRRRGQVFVSRKVVRGHRHPTGDFRHELRPIGIREGLDFIEKFLGGCGHGSGSHFVFVRVKRPASPYFRSNST